MSAENGWTVSVSSALNAHFIQPDGSSRAGADWALALSNGTEVTRLFVRVYREDVGAIPPETEAKLAAEYIFSLLDAGWLPAQYKGKPGELTVPPQLELVREFPIVQVRKPWWRFW